MEEVLSKKLDRERRQKIVPGIKIVQGTKRINISQFADNTILLAGASSIIAKRFKKIMDDYTSTSGGLINEGKSRIYAWNTRSSTLISIANILNNPFMEKWQSFKYLGITFCL
jgi:hypothetical protein